MIRPAVILDVDGTLVDSNDAHARAWVDAFTEAGVDVSPDRVRRAIGMGGDKLMPLVSGLSEDSPEGERISARRREIFKSGYLPHVQAFPRVRDLVQRIAADGFTMVVASSAGNDELRGLLRIAGVDDLISSRSSSDDAKASKPEPDIVRAALKRSGATARNAIMLGDTPYDVEAARRVGVRIVGLECGGWRAGDLQGAAHVYASPADLLEKYDASLFARVAAEWARRRRRTTGFDGRWISGALLLLGAAIAIGTMLERRRGGRTRDDAAEVHSILVNEPGRADAGNELRARRPGLGPRDRAALRRIIARTS